jgi:DivIVA domain-containing protein
VRTLEQQIRSAEFAISRKGYDPSSVDAALDAFADEVALLLAELRKESIRVSTLERSLTFAQGSSSHQKNIASFMVEVSEKKEKLLEDAHDAAASIVEDANKQAAQRLEDTGPRPETHEIEFALEEAKAIENAARDLAERIRSDAESEAVRVLESARTTAGRIEVIDTGTGVDGIELAQQYRSVPIP